MKTERSAVYTAIDSEREYQDEKWRENAGLVEGQPPRELAGELLMIEEYVARARKAWTDTPREQEAAVVTDIIRKIAGIAVRAMENHGAPGREGYGVFVSPPPPPDDDIPF